MLRTRVMREGSGDRPGGLRFSAYCSSCQPVKAEGSKPSFLRCGRCAGLLVQPYLVETILNLGVFMTMPCKYGFLFCIHIE